MLKSKYKNMRNCRVCKKNNFKKVFDFGPTPLANAFLKKEQLNNTELYFPLEVYFCNNCSFLTLGHVVNPQILFQNYVYASSTSPVFVKHFEDLAHTSYSRFKLNRESLIVDIGSNDGILLKPFKKLGSKVLGIEPADLLATMARRDGISTITSFFSLNLAKRIVGKEGKAKIVAATNVFAHIDDLDEVVRGVKELLTDDGIFLLEVYYLVDLLKKGYFDLIYHEHLYYWTVNSFIRFFNRHGLEIFDVQKIPTHGGSIRIFVQNKKASYEVNPRVSKFIKLEKKEKLFDVNTYNEFAKNVQENKISLLALLAKIKRGGKTIAGYGAPAKGNTLLNFFGIGRETIDFLIDDSPLKQGLFTPGMHIPVLPPNVLYQRKPDYLLILAWNFAPSIMKMHKRYKENGGKFIIPVPRPVIV